MGAASSKNVAKQISKGSLQISTEVSQSSSANANAANIISQVCNNVQVTSENVETPPRSHKPTVCYNAARQKDNVCSIEYTSSGENRIKTPDDDTNNASPLNKYAKRIELLEYCNENESNCKSCSNGEGINGIWSKDDYESCTTNIGCAWAPTARKAPKGKMGKTHCVSRCNAFEDASSCRNDGCMWKGGRCDDMQEITAEKEPNRDATGCEISNVNQSSNISAVSKSIQDAALNTQTSQNLSQGLKQVAQAMVTGVNFGSFSKAENIGAQIAEASTKIKNKVNMTCGSGAFAKNVVEQSCNDMTVSSKGGSATGCKLSDINQTASTKMQQECHQKAVISNKSVQDLQQVMDQLAVAKTTGLDLTAFLIAIVVCISVVFFAVFKGAATFGGQIVMAAGAFMALFGAVLWIWAMHDNGWETKSYHWGMWDYHSGPRGDGTQTHATAGLQFSDGFGSASNKPPVCREKTVHEQDAEDECMASNDRRSCNRVINKDTGERACRWDKVMCKPAWTRDNVYGWCYEKKEGKTSSDAYNACSEEERCNAFFWDSDHKIDKRNNTYKTFEVTAGNPDRYNEGDRWDVAERAECNDVACCDRSRCVIDGKFNLNHDACKNCCPFSTSGHPYAFNPDSVRNQQLRSAKDVNWNIACRRCAKNTTKPTGTYYLYERHPTQRAILPKEDSITQKNAIEPYLSCMPGLETWGAIEVERPLDLRGILGFTFLVGGVVTGTAGLIHHLTKKDPKSMLEIGQEALANAVKPKA